MTKTNTQFELRSTGVTYTKQYTSDEENEVLELIQSGEKMSAIKLARKAYGFGLKEAKEFVEDLQETE